MCGRYSESKAERILRERFGYTNAPGELRARYNIAPGQEAPVVLAKRTTGRLERRLGLLKWGLVPRWAKDPSVGNRTINARAESLEKKPSFRDSFERRRCLVVADGFYEWEKQERRKVPHWYHLAEEAPFAFAGLWDTWRGPGTKDELATFTILTTEANPVVAPVHDRMPVILDRAAEELWLDPSAAPADLAAVLRPYAGPMNDRVVGPRVSFVENDDPGLLEEASPDEAPARPSRKPPSGQMDFGW